jgi:ribosomal protein S18 acetylase RimI-like enzyme
MAEARLYRPDDREHLQAMMAEACGWTDGGGSGGLIPPGVRVWLARSSGGEAPDGFCRLVPDRETRSMNRLCLDLLFVRDTGGRTESARALIDAALVAAKVDGLKGIWGYLAGSPGEDILEATGGKLLREIRLLRHDRLNMFSPPQAPGGYRLRPVSLPADLKSVSEIYNETFSGMWNFRAHGPNDIAEWFESRDTSPEGCFILEHDGEGVGMAVLSVDPDRLAHSDPTAYIPDIGVVSAHRRKGLGNLLLGAAAERARKVGITAIELIVDEEDDRARAFYRKVGFEEMGTINVYEWK